MHALSGKEGPLPLWWRNYIAIMASRQYRCAYLIALQTQHYLINGGPVSWLRQKEDVPQKLGMLEELSTILAHQPWLLTPKHIAKLVSLSDFCWTD